MRMAAIVEQSIADRTVNLNDRVSLLHRVIALIVANSFLEFASKMAIKKASTPD